MKTVQQAQLDNARLYYAYARLAGLRTRERRDWIDMARAARALAANWENSK